MNNDINKNINNNNMINLTQKNCVLLETTEYEEEINEWFNE
jgi:hypothetical protein